MSRDTFAEDYLLLKAQMGPSLRLVHSNGTYDTILPRGVVIEDVHSGPDELLATIKVGAWRYLLDITRGQMRIVPFLNDQIPYEEALALTEKARAT